RRPQGPRHPCITRRKIQRALHFRKRIEPDAEDERTNPTEDLRLTVRLQPGLRQAARTIGLRNRDEIPHPQERSGQKHENKAADNEYRYDLLAASFATHSILRASLQNVPF